MNTRRSCLWLTLAVAVGLVLPAGPAQAGLIDTPDYGDTFTLTANGGIPHRVAGAAPGIDYFPDDGLDVENLHGNPYAKWAPAWRFLASPDRVHVNGDTTFAYGLRSNYIVQMDSVLSTSDRMDVLTATVNPAGIFTPGSKSVFFRRTNHATQIGIFNGSAETNTGFTTGIAPGDTSFHNFAVHFNHDANSVAFYVDESLRGSLNLATFAGGAYSLTPGNATAVGFGGSGIPDIDNFQVGAPARLPGLFVDYEDTFTINPPVRPDGLYNNNSGGGYNVETANFGNPPATWTPLGNFSFNTPGSSTNPALLGAAGGNPGAASGFAQSGGGDFSFAYGLQSDYIVSLDAILPSDRLDISSLPSAGAGIFGPNRLSVFFRRDTVTAYGAIGLYNGSVETLVLAPGTLGINDNDWHNFAVWFNQDDDNLAIFVDRELVAALDLTTFAGGIYQNYSNGAVGAGGAGGVFWIDNFRVGTIVPEPSTLALAALGLVALIGCTGRRRRKRD